MLERIETILRGIEASKEELEILLGLAKISFVDYIMIKRGSLQPPEHLGSWNLQQIDMEVSQLKEHIDALNKIKREVLSW